MLDLIVLDVEMPVIDGVAMLESIRRSPRTSHVPVVMASKERRSDVVAHLVKLGISGYVLKPLRPRTLAESIEQLKAKPRLGDSRRTGGPIPRLTPDSPVMIVDGDANYRRFFVEQARRHGGVIEAATGTEALAAFKRTPTAILFVGSKLGVHSADLLAQRLRVDAPNGAPLIVGIVSGRSGEPRNIYDETMRRTLLPAIHRAELQRFLPAPGPLAGVSTLIGDLSEIVLSDAQEVLGLMLDCEMQCSAQSPQPTEFTSSVTVTVDDAFTITLSASLAETPARTIASRLSNVEPSSVTEAQLLGSAGEIARLLGARLHTLVGQRDRGSEVSAVHTARVTEASSAANMPGDSGLVMTLVSDSHATEIVVRVDAAEVMARVLVEAV